MKGAFPPSSRLSFFKVPLDWLIRSLPTRVEPVKEILRTRSEEQRTLPMAGVLSSAVTEFTTPGGIPVRERRMRRAFAVKGVSPAVLRTEVQPAARAGASF